jgi:hypothetical protein
MTPIGDNGDQITKIRNINSGHEFEPGCSQKILDCHQIVGVERGNDKKRFRIGHLVKPILSQDSDPYTLKRFTANDVAIICYLERNGVERPWYLQQIERVEIKHYVLLKDLPWAKAGAIFSPQVDNLNLYCTDALETPITLTTIVNNPDWFEEFPAQPTVFDSDRINERLDQLNSERAAFEAGTKIIVTGHGRKGETKVAPLYDSFEDYKAGRTVSMKNLLYAEQVVNELYNRIMVGEDYKSAFHNKMNEITSLIKSGK